MLTVKQLKAALADLPDDAPILVKPHDSAEFANNTWRYNTRELANAYRANDDRYEQNQVLLIELGDMSD